MVSKLETSNDPLEETQSNSKMSQLPGISTQDEAILSADDADAYDKDAWSEFLQDNDSPKARNDTDTAVVTPKNKKIQEEPSISKKVKEESISGDNEKDDEDVPQDSEGDSLPDSKDNKLENDPQDTEDDGLEEDIDVYVRSSRRAKSAVNYSEEQDDGEDEEEEEQDDEENDPQDSEDDALEEDLEEDAVVNEDQEELPRSSRSAKADAAEKIEANLNRDAKKKASKKAKGKPDKTQKDETKAKPSKKAKRKSEKPNKVDIIQELRSEIEENDNESAILSTDEAVVKDDASTISSLGKDEGMSSPEEKHDNESSTASNDEAAKDDESICSSKKSKKRKKAPKKATTNEDDSSINQDSKKKRKGGAVKEEAYAKKKVSIKKEVPVKKEGWHKASIKTEPTFKKEASGKKGCRYKKCSARCSQKTMTEVAAKMLEVLIKNYKDDIKEIPMDLLASSITNSKGKAYTNHRSDAIVGGIWYLEQQDQAKKVAYGKTGAAVLLQSEIDKIPKEVISKDPAKVLEMRRKQFLERLATHKKGGTSPKIVNAANAVWEKLSDGKAYSRKELVKVTDYGGTNSGGFEAIMLTLIKLKFAEGSPKMAFTDKVFPHGRP